VRRRRRGTCRWGGWLSTVSSCRPASSSGVAL